MATPLELQVTVEDPRASDLQTDGEIYVVPVGSVAPSSPQGPVVTHVIASPLRASRFTLDKGRYEYRFHVERSGGRFTVVLVRTGDGSVVGSAVFDTAYGYEHKVFAFEVA